AKSLFKPCTKFPDQVLHASPRWYPQPLTRRQRICFLDAGRGGSMSALDQKAHTAVQKRISALGRLTALSPVVTLGTVVVLRALALGNFAGRTRCQHSSDYFPRMGPRAFRNLKKRSTTGWPPKATVSSQ